MMNTSTTAFASTDSDRRKAQHSEEIVDAKRCTVQLQSGFLYLDAVASPRTSLFGYEAPKPLRSSPSTLKQCLTEIDPGYECVALGGDPEIALRIANTIGAESCRLLDAGDFEPESDDGRISVVVENETIGRAGVWIASTLWRRQPDIIVLGSALALGEPFAAVLVSRRMPPLTASRLALTDDRALPPSTVDRVAGALHAMENDDVLGHAHRVADHFEDRLKSVRVTCPQIHSLRTAGLLASIGFAPTLDVKKIKRDLCQRGVLVGVDNVSRLRLAPSLCIRPAEVDVIIGALRGVLLGIPTVRETACCSLCDATELLPQT